MQKKIRWWSNGVHQKTCGHHHHHHHHSKTSSEVDDFNNDLRHSSVIRMSSKKFLLFTCFSIMLFNKTQCRQEQQWMSSSTSSNVRNVATATTDHSWLITTRCQLRCIDIFHISLETPTNLNNQSLNRLKHGTNNNANAMNLCTQDQTCSSCLIPCLKECFKEEDCNQICQMTAKSEEVCRMSRKFVSDISRHKNIEPELEVTNIFCEVVKMTTGTTISSSLNDHRHHLNNNQSDEDDDHEEDTDAEEDSKEPHSPPVQCSRESRTFQLHQLTVNETWETRGIHVRWKTRERSCCGERIGQRLSTIYVIQMRQLVGHGHVITTTDWTVLTTTMSKSLNLVNVLTLGLRYQLRIIAVSTLGVRNISIESRPFGLPKDIPIPSPPRNFRYRYSNGGLVRVTLHWDRPHSELPIPISNYSIRLTEEKTKKKEDDDDAGVVSSLDSSSGHSISEETDDEDDDEDEDTEDESHTLILEGKMHTYRLVNLDTRSTYIVQIRAIIRIGEKLITGEPAVLRIHHLYGNKPSDVLNTTTSQTQTQLLYPAAVMNLSVENPFYWNGSLRVRVSWTYRAELRKTIQHFLLRHRIQACPDLLDRSEHKSEDIHVDPEDYYYDLFNLRYECVYEVAVQVVSIHGFHGPSPRITFTTPPCYDMSSQAPLCPTRAFTNFECEAPFSQEDAKICRWDNPKQEDSTNSRGQPPPVLAILFEAMPYNTLQHYNNNNTMLKTPIIRRTLDKNDHKTLLKNLMPNTRYHVIIRAIGANGYGPKTHAHFYVPNYYKRGAFHRTDQIKWNKNEGTSSLYSINFTFLLLNSIVLNVLSSY